MSTTQKEKVEFMEDVFDGFIEGYKNHDCIAQRSGCDVCESIMNFKNGCDVVQNKSMKDRVRRLLRREGFIE